MGWGGREVGGGVGAGAPRTASWESGACVPLCAVVTVTETEGGERARDGVQCVGGWYFLQGHTWCTPCSPELTLGGGALGIAQRVDPKSSPHQEETVFSLFPFFLPPPPRPPAVFLFLCVCFFGSGVSVRGWAPTKLTVLVIPSTCQGRCCSAHPQPSAACPARLHSTRDTLDLAPGCPWRGDPTSPGAVCARTGLPRL